MRFALLEAKMALIEVLRQFSFVRTPDTEVRGVVIRCVYLQNIVPQVPLETVYGITMTSKNGIHLKAVCRTLT